MKILHIVPSYLPATRYGGPIQSVHNLNKALVKNGAEVTVYTTNADGPGRLSVPLDAPVNLDGVKVFYFPVRFPVSWYYSPELRRAIKENIKNFDIVHITSTFLSASTLGAYYAKKFKVPYIISPRGNFMKIPLSVSPLKKKLYIGLMEKRNIVGAAAIDFTSKEEERDYIDAGFPLKRSMVLPNGIKMPESTLAPQEEMEKFKRKEGIAPEKKVITCLGRISKIKGFDVLIPAMAELIKEKLPVKLLIIGGDDEKGYKKEVEKLVADFKIGNEVIFAGMLSGHQKEIALAASDIIVQPSESESFGMAAAEAMAAGIPVVVAKGVGVANIVSEGRAGMVIDKNSAELAGAIKKLVQNSELRSEFGASGRAAAKKYLSEESVAGKFIAKYKEIIEDYRKDNS